MRPRTPRARTPDPSAPIIHEAMSRLSAHVDRIEYAMTCPSEVVEGNPNPQLPWNPTF
ncbi:hypothetical protein K3495_g8307 [Podosphaera aphanis]|nr:hypothetical protein K3495_g8307 [Podosphaera aphanis]